MVKLTTLYQMSINIQRPSVFEELRATYECEIKCWSNNILTFERSIKWAKEEQELNKQRANHLNRMGETEAYQHFLYCLIPSVIQSIKRYENLITDCERYIHSNKLKVGECDKFLNGNG